VANICGLFRDKLFLDRHSLPNHSIVLAMWYK